MSSFLLLIDGFALAAQGGQTVRGQHSLFGMGLSFQDGRLSASLYQSGIFKQELDPALDRESSNLTSTIPTKNVEQIDLFPPIPLNCVTTLLLLRHLSVDQTQFHLTDSFLKIITIICRRQVSASTSSNQCSLYSTGPISSPAG